MSSLLSRRRVGFAAVGTLFLALLLPTAAHAAAPLVPVGELVVPRGMDPRQCQSLGNDPGLSQASLVGLRRLARLLPSADARKLFGQYLTPGVMSGSRQSLTSQVTLKEFRDAVETKKAYEAVQQDLVRVLAATPPPLRPPANPKKLTLAELKVGGSLRIDYSAGLTTPPLIAGGTGSLISQQGNYVDLRAINGDVALVPKVDGRGVRTQVTLQLRNVKLHIEDSIDFCPGALAAGTLTRPATLLMSRLERTPYAKGGTWAQPVLWQADVPLNDVSIDITHLYPTNDPDHDGWPNAQPWTPATLTLDNCPTVANPDQQDTNRNGVGDACESGTVIWPTNLTVQWLDHWTAQVTWKYNGGGDWLTVDATSTEVPVTKTSETFWEREERLPATATGYRFQNLPPDPADKIARVCFLVSAHYTDAGSDWGYDVCPQRP